MALAWVLKDKRITSVLIGASSVKQIDDNVETLKTMKFSSKDLELIEGVLSNWILVICFSNIQFLKRLISTFSLPKLENIRGYPIFQESLFY